MKSTKKTVICAAILLVAAGAFLILTAMGMGKGNWKELKAVGYEERTFPISGEFTDIQISDSENSIKILPSTDGTCKVICPEKTDGSVYHTVEVRDGILSVQRHDERSWFQFIGVNFYIGGVKVYLPEGEYGALTASSTAGSISVAEGFTFESAGLKSTSGSVRMLSQVKQELNAESASGSIRLENASPETLYAKSSSGRIELSHIHGGSITAKATAGKITLRDVIAEETLSAQNISGGVALEGCDGGTIRISCTSGSVKGALLSDKIFLTDSGSGSIRVPRSTEGGTCEITTTSGSIRIDIVTETSSRCGATTLGGINA